MSLSTIYIVVVSLAPAILGAILLTLANADRPGKKAEKARQQARYQPDFSDLTEIGSLTFDSLYPRSATQ